MTTQEVRGLPPYISIVMMTRGELKRIPSSSPGGKNEKGPSSFAKGKTLNSSPGERDMKTVAVQGLKHVALKVIDLSRSQAFYERVFGMRVVWQPDSESVYLSSGHDNLALHQIPAEESSLYRQRQGQYLDHFGFLMDSPESVDALFERIKQERVTIVKSPKHHRDGSYSFYLTDPDDNTIQVLYEPTISKGKE